MTENKKTLLPEQSDQFVTKETLEMVVKQVTETLIKQDEMTWESNKKCLKIAVDSLIKSINREYYERCRFEHFIINMFCSEANVLRESVWEKYKQYCKEFDKLNKKDSKESNVE